MKICFQKKFASYLLAVAAVACSALTAAAHDDLSPRIIGGKVVVGYHNDGFSDAMPADGLDDNDGRPQNGVPALPVFGFDVVQNYNPLDSADDNLFSSEDPGVNSLASPPGASPLTASKILFSNLLSFKVAGNPNAANLFYWNGSDANMDMTLDANDVAFIPAVGVELGLIGLNTKTVNGTNTLVTEFGWGTTSANGFLHVHADTQIYDTANPTTSPPADGIYLIGLDFRIDGATASDPVWMVYAAGIDEEVHDIAMEWVQEFQPTVVPEPSTFVLAGLAGLGGLLAWRRRKQLG